MWFWRDPGSNPAVLLAVCSPPVTAAVGGRRPRAPRSCTGAVRRPWLCCQTGWHLKLVLGVLLNTNNFTDHHIRKGHSVTTVDQDKNKSVPSSRLNTAKTGTLSKSQSFQHPPPQTNIRDGFCFASSASASLQGAFPWRLVGKPSCRLALAFSRHPNCSDPLPLCALPQNQLAKSQILTKSFPMLACWVAPQFPTVCVPDTPNLCNCRWGAPTGSALSPVFSPVWSGSSSIFFAKSLWRLDGKAESSQQSP